MAAGMEGSTKPFAWVMFGCSASTLGGRIPACLVSQAALLPASKPFKRATLVFKRDLRHKATRKEETMAKKRQVPTTACKFFMGGPSGHELHACGGTFPRRRGGAQMAAHGLQRQAATESSKRWGRFKYPNLWGKSIA
eukprot:scaffold2639_cov361-Pavlova_lutheri.AAC.27